MLPKYLYRRLAILFFFIEKRKTSLNEISNSFDCSKRVIKDDLIFLNECFETYFGCSHFLLSHYSGVIEINPAYEPECLSYVYELKLILLKQVIPFNFLVLLTTKASHSKEDLLEKLIITDTYLDKITLQLNAYLSDFDIQIKSRRGNYFLTGREEFIRLFSYILLSDSYQCIEWPFDSLPLEKIIEDIPEDLYTILDTLSESKKRQLTILYAILFIRSKDNQYLTKAANDKITYIMNILTQHFDVSSYLELETRLSLSKTIKTNEILTFNLFAHIFISDTLTREQKAEIGKSFYHDDNQYCVSAKRVVQAISQLVDTPLSNLQLNMYTYFTTLFLVWYAYTGKAFLPFVYLFLPVPPFYIQSEHPFMVKMEETIQQIVQDDQQTRFLVSLFFSLLKADQKPKLKIYLQLTKNYTAIYFIKNRLATIFNPDNIQITIDYLEADFVITDSLEYSDEDKVIFFLDDLNNFSRWQALVFSIQSKYLQKMEYLKE